MICFVIVNHRSMQEVHLDKHVKLVDSPGIVMDSGDSDSAVILRNCVKVRHVRFTLLTFGKLSGTLIFLYYIYIFLK